MNYLELVNRLRLECGISGAPLASVMGAVGEAARVVNWIDASWVDLQNHKDTWDFMRKDGSIQTVAGQQLYPSSLVADFGNWKMDTFRISSRADRSDETLVAAQPWESFRNVYIYGPQRTTQGKPVVVSVKPDRSLAFGPIPDGEYFVDFEYYSRPYSLVQNTDEPNIPARYHMLIVYRAMMMYAGFEAAPEVYQRGEMEFKRLMSRLELDQLPELTTGPALA